MIRKIDIATFICMTTLANLQLPFCKVWLLKINSVQTHVDVKMKDLDVLPENRALQRSTNDLRSRTLLNNRQDLVKVTSEYHWDTTKGLIRFQNVFQSAVDSLMYMTMLHECLCREALPYMTILVVVCTY